MVVNNAGVAALGITEAYSIARMQKLFEVNVFGAARVNRAVPAMRRQLRQNAAQMFNVTELTALKN